MVSRGPLLPYDRLRMIPHRTPYICLLTDSEIANNFCLRYWARSPGGKWSEPFQALLSDSGLSKGEMVDMLRSACHLYLPNIRCDRCGDQVGAATRSEYSSLMVTLRGVRRGSSPPLCTSCAAAVLASKPKSDFFKPQPPRERVASALKRRRENAKPVDYAKLGFVQSYLLYTALVASGIAPTGNVVPPLETQTEELSPTPELADEIYARLCTDGILLPALSSDLDAFNLDEETGAVTFSIRIGAWTLANDVAGRSMDEILSIMYRRLEQPEPKEVEALWYLVAEDECRKYFAKQWERYNFLHPGIYSAKVADAVRLYLGDCSIGQMWNIIYYAVKNLAALTQEGKHTPQHIYNMLPGGIRRYADYRLANGPSIRAWRRPHLTDSSWMTNILLDKVLKAGDIAFEMLRGKNVAEYVEYLLKKPDDEAAAAFFHPPVRPS